jgi:TonB family protein
MFHFALVLFFSLNPWPTLIKVKPMAYTVTLMPIIQEPEIPKPSPVEIPKPVIPKEEKTKPIEKPKKESIVEKVKKPAPQKEDTSEKKKESLDRLHEALEEVRKKIALDQIQKRVAKRETPPPTPLSTPAPPPSLSPSLMELKLNEYYGQLWAKIKASWTIPENLLKEKVDLEAIIVIIIEKNGKVRKSWFEEKSGNEIYDQMAMRAILKAEPLPPIPKELNRDVLEIGIRFYPD